MEVVVLPALHDLPKTAKTTQKDAIAYDNGVSNTKYITVFAEDWPSFTDNVRNRMADFRHATLFYKCCHGMAYPTRGQEEKGS